MTNDKGQMTMIRLHLGTMFGLMLLASTALSDTLPLVDGIEAQPFKAQIRRVIAALDFLGEPLFQFKMNHDH